MSDVTVKQLAESVRAPVDRLLKQMQEAGLPHTGEDQSVSEDQKQELLAFLKRSHGSDESGQKKITLKRKTVGTLKSGQGRAGRAVTVEVRKKRTYVRRAETETAASEVRRRRPKRTGHPARSSWKPSESVRRILPARRRKKRSSVRKQSAKRKKSVNVQRPLAEAARKAEEASAQAETVSPEAPRQS